MRRAELLKAALELFSEKGFENCSLKDLSDKVGVTPGLVYHYFENKHRLLIAVVEEHGFFQDCAALIAIHSKLPACKALPKIAAAYYDLLGQKEQIVRIFCREAMTDEILKSYWVRLINETVSLLSRYLETRISAGELRPHNTEVSARMILHPLAMMRLTGASADAITDLVDCAFAGIQATEATKPKRKQTCASTKSKK